MTRIPRTTAGVRIFYALSYYKDAGDPVDPITSHNGDSEFIVIDIQDDMNPSDYTRWEVNDATLSAHWSSTDGANGTEFYGAGSLEYPEVHRGRPRVWGSWDKPANYPTKGACQNSTWDTWDTWDTPTTGTVYDDLEVRSDANLGNMFDIANPTPSRELMNCVTSRHPGTGGAGYGVECDWTQGAYFDGWKVRTAPTQPRILSCSSSTASSQALWTGRRHECRDRRDTHTRVHSQNRWTAASRLARRTATMSLRAARRKRVEQIAIRMGRVLVATGNRMAHVSAFSVS